MATGRVLQFDQVRGYGFIAADDGGEDIFLHASVFDGDLDDIAPGMKLEFKVMAGDRGRKAFAAHLIGGEIIKADEPLPLAQALQTVPAPAQYQTDEQDGDEQDDEHLCDVLTRIEFERELTDLLLSNAPALTGLQIIQVRHIVLEVADKHGWIDS